MRTLVTTEASGTASPPCGPRGTRRWCSPSRWPPRSGRWRSSAACCCTFGLAGVAGARCCSAGWWPATGCARSTGSPPRSSTSRVTEDLDAAAGARATTRWPGSPRRSTRCCSRSAPPATAQRRLVADASHELRTPLTSLRTNLELLRQARATPALPAERAARAARRRPRPDRGAERPRRRPGRAGRATSRRPAVVAEVDLADVVERAVTRVRRRAHGRLLRRGARPVAGRRRRQQPRAGGHQPARQRRQVEPAPRAPSPCGCPSGVLTVDDQGTGVAEADRPHVFERFYRAEESRAMPGSGLGLAIVRQVIDRHGGQLQVTEAPGGGARFALWLPGVAAVTPGSRRRRAAAARPSTPTRPTRRRRRTSR